MPTTKKKKKQAQQQQRAQQYGQYGYAPYGANGWGAQGGAGPAQQILTQSFASANNSPRYLTDDDWTVEYRVVGEREAKKIVLVVVGGIIVGVLVFGLGSMLIGLLRDLLIARRAESAGKIIGNVLAEGLRAYDTTVAARTASGLAAQGLARFLL